VLLTATLAACGGDSGDATGQPASGERPADTDTSSASTSAADTPTPEARTQDGAELTTQEYAEALEEALSGPDDEIVEDAFERFFGRNRLSSDETERLWSLENAESWSEEDVRLANKYAEAGQRAATGFFDFVLGLLKRTPEEVSSLRPPKHLSELHRDFAEALGELTRFSLQPMEQLLDEVREADTDIRNREELAEFEALVNSLEFPSVDPEPGQQGEDLSKQAEAACQALEGRLEPELGRDVNICSSDGTSERPPEPRAAPSEVTPTPTAQTQAGADLTMQQYAEALEEANSIYHERVADAGVWERLAEEQWVLPDEAIERMDSLEANVSWLEEDAQFARIHARLRLSDIVGALNHLAGAIGGYLDTLSSLQPPQHLSALHIGFAATFEEFAQAIEDHAAAVSEIDTEIGNGEELADFRAMIDSVRLPDIGPDLEGRLEATCLELEDQLVVELGRDVSICQ